MKYLFVKIIAFLAIMLCLLLFPSDSKQLATEALVLWYQNMVPALLPFMILSKMAIQMNLTGILSSISRIILYPLFRLSPSCDYAICIGFLCGFPMGAATVAQLYDNKDINHYEAELLLMFVNNIGPIYTLSILLIHIPNPMKSVLLFAFYLVPILYGMFLRHVIYRDYIPYECQISWNNKNHATNSRYNAVENTSVLRAFEMAVSEAIPAVTKLGAYMIFVNLLRILPQILFTQSVHALITISLLLEINSGLEQVLQYINNTNYSVGVLFLSFFHLGGLSCLMQTSCVTGTLSFPLKKYIFHKVIQTIAAFLIIYLANILLI